MDTETDPLPPLRSPAPSRLSGLRVMGAFVAEQPGELPSLRVSSVRTEDGWLTVSPGLPPVWLRLRDVAAAAFGRTVAGLDWLEAKGAVASAQVWSAVRPVLVSAGDGCARLWGRRHELATRAVRNAKSDARVVRAHAVAFGNRVSGGVIPIWLAVRASVLAHWARRGEYAARAKYNAGSDASVALKGVSACLSMVASGFAVSSASVLRFAQRVDPSSQSASSASAASRLMETIQSDRVKVMEQSVSDP